jgi:hypothetical protein
MSDGDHTTIEQRHAHEVVRLLRVRLSELGLPDDQIRQVLPVSDYQRRAHVRMGTLTVASAEKILRALTVTEPAP